MSEDEKEKKRLTDENRKLKYRMQILVAALEQEEAKNSGTPAPLTAIPPHH